MLPIFLFLFNVVNSAPDVIPNEEKLIRVNEWHEIPIDNDTYEDALLDFHLFATCEKFSVLFLTETQEATRFDFSYYDSSLRKIDVESVGVDGVVVPETPKMLNTCLEKSRKILRVKIRASNDTLIFKIDDQLIRRPFPLKSDKLRVLIPQKVACCLIRALFLSNHDLKAFSSATTSYDSLWLKQHESHVSVVSIGTTSTSERVDSTSTTLPPPSVETTTNQWSKFTIGDNPVATTTTTDEPKPESSWTHAVNKEWSITFVLCSIVICTIMLFLAVFGTFTVFYLMTKPSGGKSPFAVDA